MVIIGLWVRLRLVESETFVKAEEQGAIKKFPLGTVIRRHWRHLILGTFIMLATYVLFYLMTNFTLSYGTKPADLALPRHRAGGRRGDRQPFDATAFAAQFYPGLGFGYTDFVIMQIIGVVFFGIFTLLSGPLADRIGTPKAAAVGHRRDHRVRSRFTVFLLPQADPKFTGALTQAFLIIGFMLMGATFGPMGALLPGALPDERALLGLGDRLQRVVDPRRRRRAPRRCRPVAPRATATRGWWASTSRRWRC